MSDADTSAQSAPDGLLTELPVRDGPNSGVSDAQLDPETVFAGANDATSGAVVAAEDRRERFAGDTSELPAEACWALQALVGDPHVSEGAKHWPVLLQYENVLRSRLAELGLLLEIDHERRFAFTKQAQDPSPRSRKLLRTDTLNLAASTLLLHLYQQYLVSAGDPIVDTDDLVEHILTYKPASDTDSAGFEKKVHAAIRRLERAWVITRINNTHRFVINPAVTSLVTPDQLETLEQRYRAIAHGEAVGASDNEDASEPDDTDDTDTTNEASTEDD